MTFFLSEFLIKYPTPPRNIPPTYDHRKMSPDMLHSLRQVVRAYADGDCGVQEYISRICSFMTQVPSPDALDLLESDDDPFALSVQRLTKSRNFEPMQSRYEQMSIVQDLTDNPRFIGLHTRSPKVCLRPKNPLTRLLTTRILSKLSCSLWHGSRWLALRLKEVVLRS
jgi:hypothetical protein